MSERARAPFVIRLAGGEAADVNQRVGIALAALTRIAGGGGSGRGRRFRVTRMGDDLTVSVAHSRVGAVGPIVEAVADANGLRVEIPALDALVPSAGLEGSPSRVWAAIGRAVFEFGSQSGQSAHQLDPFTYVRVVDGDGPRVAEVALPSLHPTGAMPSDFSPTKYDDWDWHTGDLGIRVWYDEFSLRLGDSLRRNIDRGLADSRFGVVVLSHAFFAKNWPQYELDGLVTRESTGQQVILPIWHNISKDDVIAYSPSLADKIAARTADSTISEIAAEIAERVRA